MHDVHAEPDPLTALTARFRDRVDDLVDNVMQRLAGEIPLYASLDADTTAGVRFIVLDTMHRCLTAIAERRLPNDDDLALPIASAANRVGEGWPLDVILHAYRLGVTVWWETSRTEEFRGLGDRDLDLALEMASGFLRCLDAVQSAVVRSYVDEQERLAADVEHHHAQLIEALLDHDPGDRRTSAMAERAGIVLPEEVVVAHLRPTAGPGGAPRLAREARAIGAQVVTAVRGDAVLALWPAGSDATARAGAAELVRGGVAAAVGVRGPVADGLRAAAAEAEWVSGHAMATGGGVHQLEDHLLAAMVQQVGGRVPELLAARVAPLDGDDPGSRELVETLATYLACDGSLAEAARRLHVHRNTVTYRLDRIAALTGTNPRVPTDLMLLHAGLMHRLGPPAMFSP